MTYDFANMIQHTCLNPGDVSATAVAADDSACLNLVEEMEEFVDKMVEETDNGATQIWDEVYKKFYLESNRVVRGLSKRQVVSRVSNIKAAQNGKDIYSMLESPKMSKVKNDVVSFFSLITPGTTTPRQSTANQASSICSVGLIRSCKIPFDTVVYIGLLTEPSGWRRKDFTGLLLSWCTIR
ncbi:hypothetical protein L916_03993 [Phytophthora nicotianae]|uniref:Uncharacterized protein n=1 Tax=Phytophthora nicotianae TaxID=4792 RepID=W2JKE1_PHYNI|nr:hypothetical protein L916_03993 [Phytophthora nicotianae]